MGVVAIPPTPLCSGTCRVHLELSQDEARMTIDRLKLMIERLRERGVELVTSRLAAQQILTAPSATSVPAAISPPAKFSMPAPLAPTSTASVAPAPAAAVASWLSPVAQNPSDSALLSQAFPRPTPAAPAQNQHSSLLPLPPPQPLLPSSFAPTIPVVTPPTMAPAPLQPHAAPSALYSHTAFYTPDGSAAAAVAAAAAAAAARPPSAGAFMPPSAVRPGLAAAATPVAPGPPVAQFRPVVQPPVPAVMPTSAVPRAYQLRPTGVSQYRSGTVSGSVSGAAAAAAAAAAASGAQLRATAQTAPAATTVKAPAAAVRPMVTVPAPAAPRPLPAPPSSCLRTAATAAMPQLSWSSCLETDASDHNRDAVLALHYCSALEGLPGGDGHGGWLVSSSRRLFNLWECNAGGGRGMPSLMLLHSTETDIVATSLAFEPRNRVLFAASADHKTGAESVTVHSLDPDAGMLSLRYRLAVTNPNVTRPTQPVGTQPPPRMLSKVASFDAFGGGLGSTCGAAYQGTVLVFDAPGVFAPAGTGPGGLPPKGSWKAHDNAAITAMTTTTLGNSARVVTGARDGSVIIWDMRVRPPGNSWRSRSHQQSVTGLQITNDSTLVTSSLDGKVHIWDLRSSGSPLSTSSPDGSAVLSIKTSPSMDCVAVITQRGLLTVDLLDRATAVTPITTAPLSRPYADIVWNTATAEIYAATATGSIIVYRQSYAQL